MSDPLNVPAPSLLVLSAARLRALGLEPISRELVLIPGDTLKVDLAIPPVAALGSQLCPAAADSLARTADRTSSVPAGRGIVVGLVHDDNASSRAQPARVVATWAVDEAGDPTSEPTIRTAHRLVFTDATHRYALCGLPVNVPLTLRAESGEVRGKAVEVTLTERWLGEEVLTIGLITSRKPPRDEP